MEYGYQNRPPMPDPFVTGGVAEPRNQWPRKIKSGLGGDSGTARQILTLLNSSNAAIVAGGLLLTEYLGGGTIVATVNGWDATWKRTGRLIDLTGNSALSIGHCRSIAQLEMSPAAMCQLNVTGAAGYYAPYVFRISTIIASRSTTMPALGTAGAAFGISNYSLLPVTIPSPAFIGFAATWTAPATYSTWSTWIDNTAGTLARASNLTVSTNEPHLLEVEFNAPDRMIYWLVDGEIVDGYAPADGDCFTHVTYGSSIGYVVNASNTTVTRILTSADTVPLVSVTLVDLEDGT